MSHEKFMKDAAALGIRLPDSFYTEEIAPDSNVYRLMKSALSTELEKRKWDIVSYEPGGSK